MKRTWSLLTICIAMSVVILMTTLERLLKRLVLWTTRMFCWRRRCSSPSVWMSNITGFCCVVRHTLSEERIYGHLLCTGALCVNLGLLTFRRCCATTVKSLYCYVVVLMFLLLLRLNTLLLAFCSTFPSSPGKATAFLQGPVVVFRLSSCTPQLP